jgi:nucleoside-diphosphate-sugar epimerase
MTMEPRLFCFGLGYAAEVLARHLLIEGWRVAGTAREPERVAALRRLGIDAHRFDGDHLLPADALDEVTHLLASVPPVADGDPVLLACGPAIVAAKEHLRWIGYLSTTGVYGDYRGAWVDETAPLRPTSERAWRRVAAEAAWLDLNRFHDLPVRIFRLAGIYGPGRSVLDDLRKGTARRIVKRGQVFSRIHVEDIATVLRASMDRPQTGDLYNVCDDEAARPQDVIAFACDLLGRPPPPEIPFEQAELSPMAQTFWADNRRVRNNRIKTDLEVRLAYPTYREGLRAILATESQPAEVLTRPVSPLR